MLKDKESATISPLTCRKATIATSAADFSEDHRRPAAQVTPVLSVFIGVHPRPILFGPS
jgi:hypothetical protein